MIVHVDYVFVNSLTTQDLNSIPITKSHLTDVNNQVLVKYRYSRYSTILIFDYYNEQIKIVLTEKVLLASNQREELRSKKCQKGLRNWNRV